ncbi:unnamed protein product [Haemonchus placei]|uniref:Reverse transcriptase n=1 Tax=Haemonchus placei TaxID=6290 RepID=A0A0N4X2A3_HAEPC|nr:unnamed protein product [Haemonchus placei]
MYECRTRMIVNGGILEVQILDLYEGESLGEKFIGSLVCRFNTNFVRLCLKSIIINKEWSRYHDAIGFSRMRRAFGSHSFCHEFLNTHLGQETARRSILGALEPAIDPSKQVHQN